jgi:hypothetical protein
MNKKINWIAIYIMLFCIFLTAISTYLEHQQKKTLLGQNVSLESHITT